MYLKPFQIIWAHQRLSFAKLPCLTLADSDCVLCIVESLNKLLRKILVSPGNILFARMYLWFRRQHLSSQHTKFQIDYKKKIEKKF